MIPESVAVPTSDGRGVRGLVNGPKGRALFAETALWLQSLASKSIQGDG